MTDQNIIFTAWFAISTPNYKTSFPFHPLFPFSPTQMVCSTFPDILAYSQDQADLDSCDLMPKYDINIKGKQNWASDRASSMQLVASV